MTESLTIAQLARKSLSIMFFAGSGEKKETYEVHCCAEDEN